MIEASNDPASIAVRHVRLDDLDWIVETIGANNRASVPVEDRATNGFIQGSFSAERLVERLDGPGMWLAEVDGQRAGVALSSAAQTYRQGPPGMAMAMATEKLAGQRLFMYGPVVVAKQFRGHGVLRHIFDAMIADTINHFDYAIAFVDEENVISKDVHLHLGFQVLGSFEARDTTFYTLALKLADAKTD